MRNLLAFLAALTLTLAAVGWYLDWYHIRTGRNESGQKSVTVDINTKKIGEDLLEAERKIQQRLAEKAKEETEKASAKKSLDIPAPPHNIEVISD
ncbi:MAG: hypothetical protein U0840_15810 [Gemmataceae bacterium]